MADKTFLNWPFFEDHHRALAAQLEDWATDKLASVDHSDTDTCLLYTSPSPRDRG